MGRYMISVGSIEAARALMAIEETVFLTKELLFGERRLILSVSEDVGAFGVLKVSDSSCLRVGWEGVG